VQIASGFLPGILQRFLLKYDQFQAPHYWKLALLLLLNSWLDLARTSAPYWFCQADALSPTAASIHPVFEIQLNENIRLACPARFERATYGLEAAILF